MFAGFKNWLAKRTVAEDLEELRWWRFAHERHMTMLKNQPNAIKVLENMHAEVYSKPSKAILVLSNELAEDDKARHEEIYRRGLRDGREEGARQAHEAAHDYIKGALV